MTTIRSEARIVSIAFLFLTIFRNVNCSRSLEIGRQESLNVGLVKCSYRNLAQSNTVTGHDGEVRPGRVTFARVQGALSRDARVGR